MVAPYGREVMRWLSGVFRLEDSDDPVSDEALQNSGEFPKLDNILSQELIKCAEKGCTAVCIKINGL